MPKPTVIDKIARGGDEYMMTRKLALEKVKPLDAHVVSCLDFLGRIDHLEVTDTTQKGKSIVIQVYKKPAENASPSPDHQQQPVWFTIERSRKEISKLHSTLHYWADMHIDLEMYKIPPCGYCAKLTQDRVLWPSGAHSIFTSTAARQRVLGECLNEYVERARGATDHDRVCLGMEHVPSVMVRFLLYDVDQATL